MKIKKIDGLMNFIDTITPCSHGLNAGDGDRLSRLFIGAKDEYENLKEKIKDQIEEQ